MSTRENLLADFANLLWGYDEHVLDSDPKRLVLDITAQALLTWIDLQRQAITDRQEANEKRAMALRMGQ